MGDGRISGGAAGSTAIALGHGDLEGRLPADHHASFVESLDLSPLYDRVLSREGEAGRPAADPPVLVALWLCATVERVGSARELERLGQSDVAYR